MPMNSFSFVRPANAELETTELLDLHPEGEVFSSTKLDILKNFEFKPVDLKALQKSWKDRKQGRRNSPRLKINLNILICNHQKVFRTRCENISLTGLKLIDQLPTEFLGSTCDVVVVYEFKNKTKKHIVFRGQPLLFDSCRIIFTSAASHSKKLLLKLIKNSA